MRFILVLLVIFILVCTLSITNLDMFRLGYIYTQHWLGTCLYRLISGQYAHFIFPENTRKPKGFRCFQGVKNGNNGQKQLSQICNTKMRTCLENFFFISVLIHEAGWGRG